MSIATKLLLVLGVLTVSAPTWAEEHTPIILHYFARPPFIQEFNGQLSGVTGTPAIESFTRAHIAFKLQSTPTNRQLLVIKLNHSAECGIGWFKNSERESFANFTKPIYRDSPWVMVKHKELSSKPQSLKELLNTKHIRLLIRDNFSYGIDIDRQLTQSQASILRTSSNVDQMFKMIASRRADFMFSSQEEAQHQLKVRHKNLSIVTLSDLPAGEWRHIMCSKKVPEKTIARLNLAIPDIPSK